MENILIQHPIMTKPDFGISSSPTYGLEVAFYCMEHYLEHSTFDDLIKDLEVALSGPDAETSVLLEETLGNTPMWSEPGFLAVRELVKRIYGK
jgi:hypothetical protein